MSTTERVREILSWYNGQPAGVLANLHKFMMTGRLAGTGKMVVLPVDQGFEHGPARSFAKNPEGYDPRYHFRLAIESGCCAHAAPLGALETGAYEYAGEIPLILKLNNSDVMAKTENPISAVTGSVKDALRIGASAIGFTIYPGSQLRKEMYEEIKELIDEARDCGLPTVLWAYPRGQGMSKEGETGIDVVAYAAHVSCQLGAHIVKVKPPTAHLEIKEAKKVYEEQKIPIGTLAERTRHVVHSCFNGRRIVIFSGGETKSDADVMNDVKELAKGGAFGSIMGRNAFQRPHAEAVKLLVNVMDTFKAAGVTTQAMGVGVMADDKSQPVLKLIALVAAVVVFGALLAPPLYAVAQWGIGVGVLPSALAPFKFPKYVTRAMLIVAVALIWPFVRWLGVRSTADLGLRKNPDWPRHFSLGVLLGVVGLATAALVVVATGRAEFRDPLPYARLLEALATAVTVAVLEEWLFRGVLFGLARRTSPWPRALVVISLVFALLHFVRAPPQAPVVDVVHWYSGLALVPEHLWQFGEPTLLVGSLPTYFFVGAALAYATAKTSSLALAIGLHSGWVFALRGFSFLTRRHGEPSIWLGSDLIGGIVPALLVVVTLGVLLLIFRGRQVPT